MTTNAWDNYDDSYPYWIDFNSIQVEENEEENYNLITKI